MLQSDPFCWNFLRKSRLTKFKLTRSPRHHHKPSPFPRKLHTCTSTFQLSFHLGSGCHVHDLHSTKRLLTKQWNSQRRLHQNHQLATCADWTESIKKKSQISHKENSPYRDFKCRAGRRSDNASLFKHSIVMFWSSHWEAGVHHVRSSHLKLHWC